VTKSDKNVWRRFCVVGGGDSVWVAGKFYFFCVGGGQILFFATHRHTDRQTDSYPSLNQN
jgi:hypothetical protein